MAFPARKVFGTFEKRASVSQRSPNFSGPSRLPRFPLHPRNAKVFSHQTSRPLGFSYKKILKHQFFQESGLTATFSSPKSSRDFRETDPRLRYTNSIDHRFSKKAMITYACFRAWGGTPNYFVLSIE